VLVLTRSELAGLLQMEDVIGAVEAAHAALSEGQGFELGPASVPVVSSSVVLIPMLATLAGGAGGMKLLVDSPANAARGLPTQRSTIVLVDTDTGACEALLDGAAITVYRTAAASAVATRHLARQGPSVLGFVGAGALARSHLTALRCVRPIRRVLVWSRTPATVAGFVAHAADQGVEAVVCDTPEAVVAGCGILCTLTPSRTPIVQGRWFHPGLHVNAVGSPPRSDHREIDTEGIVRSRVVVDSLALALQKSGDLMIPLAEAAITSAHFAVDLGQVVLGRRPGRESPDQITLYNSVGLGAQDIATARLAVAVARRKGLGSELDLSA
jgi:ornithine cyclodeaminase/alanine dehydrogenase